MERTVAMSGVVHKQRAALQWKPTPYVGVEICGLRRNDTEGGAVLIRIARGARFPHRRLRGRRGLTARGVFDRSRDRRAMPSALAALNMLYVLVATGRASIDRRRASRELFFNVRKDHA